MGFTSDEEVKRFLQLVPAFEKMAIESWAPWYVVNSNDKKKARLNLITHLLGSIRYEKVKRDKVRLPRRGKARGYKEPDYPYKTVPEKF